MSESLVRVLMKSEMRSSPVYNGVGGVKTFFILFHNFFGSSTYTPGVASRERSQGRPAKRGVTRRPLTPRTARQNLDRTKRELRLTQDSFAALDQGSLLRIPRGI